MNKQILKRVIFAGLFAVPFIPFLVSSPFFFPFITTKAFAFRIIVEVIFAVWIILALTDSKYKPKRSIVLYAVSLFIFIVGVADLFGVEPVKSFWSNFERMEGYITMLHLLALFLVIGSVFEDKEWRWWWNTSLIASLIMIFYCLFQLAGVLRINQGGVRVDGTLGNASYLALYFLIHIFIALYYFAKSKVSSMRWVYGALILGQMFILYSTATRGAIFGLLGGFFLVALINLKNKEDLRIRKWSRNSLIVLTAFVALFFLARNTDFVKSSPVMSRFSNLSISSLKTEGRAFVWPMALEGIKERPILGWGQDNFNYVFAKHYSGQMYKIEPWFDRAHNIFLDWGISAGLLGLLSYLSLYVVLFIQIWKKDTPLSFLERSTLTGLLSAYFFNNFFVFDNLISYVLFFSLLAYIHSKRTNTSVSPVQDSDDRKDLAMISSSVFVVLVLLIYFINVKPIIANTSLIKALNYSQMEGKKGEAMKFYKTAYETSRLGRPEVTEWISAKAPEVLGDESVSMVERNAYFEFAKNAMEEITKDLSDDPRYELIAGNFYLSFGLSQDADRHLSRALELMPEKQIIHFNLGQLALQQNNFEEALSHFKNAYDLAPEYGEAKMTYLLGAVYTRDTELINELVSTMDGATLIDDPRVLAALYQTNQKSFLLSLLRNLRGKIPDKKLQIDEYIKQIEEGSL